jgi:hypothetical protein
VALQCGRGDEPDEATLKLISSIQAALAQPITIFEGKTIALGAHHPLLLCQWSTLSL